MLTCHRRAFALLTPLHNEYVEHRDWSVVVRHVQAAEQVDVRRLGNVECFDSRSPPTLARAASMTGGKEFAHGVLTMGSSMKLAFPASW